MNLSYRILGYDVHYVHDDMNIQELLYRRRVIWTTWESAMSAAQRLSETNANNHEGLRVLSICSADSKIKCDSTGRAIIYRHVCAKSTHPVSEVMVYAIYAGD
jgi:hypothetical protein